MNDRTETDEKFPMKFEDIKVSTKTIIAVTNLKLHINDLFEKLPITDYTIVPKKRGRKKKTEVVQQTPIKPGSILTLKLGGKFRGVDLKKKKVDVKSTSFRNSLTVVMVLNDKYVNFKISNNGKFQIVGCKSWKHALEVITNIWDMIRDNTELYTLQKDKNLTVIFIPAMRNIDFNTGFKIDREKLDSYINENTPYTSILETSVGYTGVNIKIPLSKPITELDKLRMIQYKDGSWQPVQYISYHDYITTLPLKESKKLIDKKRYTTFLIFHSGKCIMSSISKEFMLDSYDEFVNMLTTCRTHIEEKIT
jgi:TATA-box binding protein (TBP) (component of TFIID and TFIIIB)